MADQKGTGKHPQKMSEESHTKKQGSSGQKSSGTAIMEREEEKQESAQGGESMKERERDSKGHFTKVHEEQHKGGKASKSR